MERRAGTETRLLPFLDDGRLLASEEGERGTYTLWKHHGVQYELRENGIPLGTYCGRSDVCPQFSGLVLTAALPLALHEAPAARLDPGFGERQHARRDARISRRRRHLRGTGQPAGRIAQSRGLAERPCQSEGRQPRAVCRARPGLCRPIGRARFDAIVADTDGVGVATGTPYFTREFYAAASRQLAEDGIFAQRFQYVDFGPVARAEHAGHAEIGLLASRGDRGRWWRFRLLGHEFAQGTQPGRFAQAIPESAGRPRASHVGWDWSVALNLGTYWGERCDAARAGCGDQFGVERPVHLPTAAGDDALGCQTRRTCPSAKPASRANRRVAQCRGERSRIYPPAFRRAEATRADDGLSRSAVGLSQGRAGGLEEASAHGDRRVG